MQGGSCCERCVFAKMCFVYCVAGESVLRMRAPCTVRWKSPFSLKCIESKTKPRTNLVAAQALYKVHATKSRRLKGKQKHLSPQPLEEEERRAALITPQHEERAHKCVCRHVHSGAGKRERERAAITWALSPHPMEVPASSSCPGRPYTGRMRRRSW